MMERFPSPNNADSVKRDSENTPSASELAAAMSAARNEGARVEVGTVDPAALRDALKKAQENPINV